MTITIECDHGDYSGGENIISQLGVTMKKGVSAEDLKKAELARCQSVWNIHRRTHPGHSATFKFLVPEGHVKRGEIIYKAK